MKKIDLKRNKLTAYSGMAVALLSAGKSEAQITYTDIEPNILFDNMGSPIYVGELIDMNNDGIMDLEIRSRYFSSSTSSGPGNVVQAIPLNNNKVENSNGFFNCFCHANANNYGDVISSNPPGLQWKKLGYLYSFIEPVFDWKDGQEHYMGIQFKLSNNKYYGWVRLKVLGAGNPIEIMDYALNTIPNQPITAGQTLGCADGFENNNNFGSAKPVVTGHIYHGLVNVGTDKDFFKWTYTADPLKPNVQISLLNLPKNYNLRLYDASQVLLATSASGGLTTEKIFYNNTLANGTYYIKVYPGSSAQFDATNCYSLQIEKRSTPYPKISDSDTQVPKITSIKVFPNPAENQITFLRSNGFITELRIMDISGREVAAITPGTEQVSVSADISNLPEGTYFARITGSDELIVTKFIVQK